MKQLEIARIGIASQALGIAQAALDLAVDYSSVRKAFGQPINQLQAVKVLFYTLTKAASHLKYFAASTGRHGYQTRGCQTFSVAGGCYIG